MKKIRDKWENYINEIIRINYKCNWACKFCNVFKTNNFGLKDISSKEVVDKILKLTRKYSQEELNNLILSFSWGEPTLNKNVFLFIKLAKQIWIWTIQIQTNWLILYKNKNYINKLIDYWLDEIFLAQHWYDKNINKKMWTYFLEEDFLSWVNYIIEYKLYKQVKFHFNIVINKINIFHIYNYLIYLRDNRLLDILPIENNYWFKNTRKISFGLVQPNWYAEINEKEVVLRYNSNEIIEIKKIINLCEENKIYPDFHFTAPPLCVLNYPEYNLEYKRLQSIKNDINNNIVSKGNFESYMLLAKEKQKFVECKKCIYNDYCLWFYKNWIKIVWKEDIKEKIIKKFINNKL